MKPLKPVALQPIKYLPKSNDHVFFTADIESQEWINLVTVGLYNGKDFFHFTNTTDFFKEAFHQLDLIDQKTVTIFVHFGGKFDFNFFIKEAVINPNYVCEAIIPRGSGILSFNVAQVPHSWPKKVKYESCEHDNKIIFRDSFALLPFSLRKLCESFKVKSQKGYLDYDFVQDIYSDIDYTPKLFQPENKKKYNVLHKNKPVKNLPKKYKPENISYYNIASDDKKHLHKIYTQEEGYSYLKNDCISLHQVISKFYSWDLIAGSGKAYTAAGQATKVLRTFLSKKIEGIYDENDAWLRDAYNGGRTEVIKPIFDKKIHKTPWIYYYDINSLYPTVMCRNVFPAGIRKNNLKGKKQYSPKGHAVWDVTVQVPKSTYFPVLGLTTTFTEKIVNNNFNDLSERKKKDLIGTEKFIFPTGTFRGKWTNIELEYAKKQGVKILKYHRGMDFHNAHYIFDEFIGKLYTKRKKAVAEGDLFTNMIVKLLMNSSYGKFGMVRDKENLEIYTAASDQKGMNIKKEIYLNENEVIAIGSRPVTLDKSYCNVAIALWVTALARLELHKWAMKINPKNIFYTDTDSIFTQLPIKTGTDLGDMKLEYKCSSAAFLLPKTYINEGIADMKFKKKVTMKGFDKKKTMHLTVEDIQEAIKGDLSNLFINEKPKFATLKQALQKGFFLAMVNDPMFDKMADERKQQQFNNLVAKNKKKMSTTDFKIWYKSLKKKNFIKKEYKNSVKRIKSGYDKRVITKKGLDSKPIFMG